MMVTSRGGASNSAFAVVETAEQMRVEEHLEEAVHGEAFGLKFLGHTSRASFLKGSPGCVRSSA